MRTLIDIQDELIKDLLRETRAKTKKGAIVIAIESYLSQKRREALASLIGNYDFGYNLEELEEMRKDD